jgi:bifunctional DNase/RNase
MELVQLAFDKIMQTRSYTEIVLKARDVKNQEKKFAIYVDSSVGKTLQAYLTEIEKERPQTHDFISSLFKGFDILVKHVIINDVQDTIYYARLFLEQQRGGVRYVVEIDGRPSDFITIALMHNAPVYCSKDVFEKVVPLVE